MARLIEASKEGQLSDRGKPEQFQVRSPRLCVA